MTVRVLIVDDSVFFRNRIAQILQENSGIEVVGSAKNGIEAVAKAKALRPDVITMDVEMPEMDGITALKNIMEQCPCKVLMLSSLTLRSAAVTLEALDSGAADYMEKDAREWVAQSESTGSRLVEKVLAIANARAPRPVQRTPATVKREMPAVSSSSKADDVSVNVPVRTPRGAKQPDCKIVTIGSSTGGPAALQAILTGIKADFPVPILITQHMPKTFTAVFSRRLDELCQITVKEAEDGDRLLPGHAYLAPGGLQMILDPNDPGRLKIFEGDQRVNYKPCVDLTYASVAKGYNRKVLAIILTGMGADGCDGARLLQKAGATVWAQDKESCTIFGMPRAVIEAELADSVLSLSEIGSMLERWH